MPAPLSPEKRAEILSLRKLPMRDIARKTKTSLGAVQGVLGAAKHVSKKRAPPPASPKGAAATPDADGTPLDRLTRSLAALESAATLAAADKDVARMVQVERAVGDLTNLIARLTPAPPPDHDAAPDIVAAAKACRASVFGMLERIIAESEAPK